MIVPWADVLSSNSWYGVRTAMVEFAPRTLIPPHAHPEEHLYILTRGTYSAAVKGESSVDCRPGSIVFRPAGCCHSDLITADGCTEARLELPPVCRAWLPTKPGHFYSESLAGRLEVLIEDRRRQSEWASAYVELFGFLWETRRHMLAIGDRPWLMRLLDLLTAAAEDEGWARANASPDGLAARLGLSRSTLQAWAIRCCGVAVGRLLRQARVLATARRIVSSSTALACIAVEAGYADQPHMTREIKSWLGTTPAGLRGRDDGHAANRRDRTPIAAAGNSTK